MHSFFAPARLHGLRRYPGAGFRRKRAMHTLIAIVCTWLAIFSLPAWSSSDSVFLEELTWTELRDDIHAGKTTVIIPIGGTEQSGPHMALGKHNVRVKALAGKIAAFCLLYTSPSPRDGLLSRMPSSA